MMTGCILDELCKDEESVVLKGDIFGLRTKWRRKSSVSAYHHGR